MNYSIVYNERWRVEWWLKADEDIPYGRWAYWRSRNKPPRWINKQYGARS